MLENITQDIKLVYNGNFIQIEHRRQRRIHRLPTRANDMSRNEDVVDVAVSGEWSGKMVDYVNREKAWRLDFGGLEPYPGEMGYIVLGPNKFGPLM